MSRNSTARRGRLLFSLFDRLFAFERSYGDAKVARQARPNLTTLEDRVVPDGRPFPLPTLFVGSGTGDLPQVRVYNGETGKLNFSVQPFGPNFGGGNAVASGDFNHDGMPDLLVAAGPGGGPRV